jgi:hypothetical protein
VATLHKVVGVATGQASPEWSESDKARVQAGQVRKLKTKVSTEFSRADAESKLFTALQAQAALAGSTLHALDGGGYPICRWELPRELPDLRAVCHLLCRSQGAS